ncbi:tyrosine-type recombinase/integrase [Undibacterium sp. MH2W]|uniref:tyrosine-type recombinase/integrase n=1 Tax=Undibacterium sp. MH2W TaxID=3413044 RepID=UPI003BF19C2A
MYEFPDKVKLTKSEIDRLPFSPDKQKTVHDTQLPGFAIRIGSASKTFIVYKRTPYGVPKRVTIGRYGHLTVDQARVLAQQELAKIAQGIDPNQVKKEAIEKHKKDAQVESQTLQWLLEEYKQEHLIDEKGGKSGTLTSMKSCMDYMSQRTITLLKKNQNDEWVIDRKIELESWLNRPFRQITREEILERFDYFNRALPTKISKKGLAPIVRTHQVAFTLLNSAYNFIIPRLQLDEKENFRNPVDVLKVYKRWKATNVKTRHVEFQKVEIADWWNAIEKYSEVNPVASAYILFSLLQAGRSIDIANMQWSQVDFELNQVTYFETKNGEDYTFPISKLACEILKKLWEIHLKIDKEAKEYPFVFAYPESETGHIPQDARHHFKQLEELSGKFVSHHDLRRTWGSAAHLMQADGRIINYCLKHKMTDVNVRYLLRNQGTILDTLQTVENFFISQVEKFRQIKTTKN